MNRRSLPAVLLCTVVGAAANALAGCGHPDAPPSDDPFDNAETGDDDDDDGDSSGDDASQDETGDDDDDDDNDMSTGGGDTTTSIGDDDDDDGDDDDDESSSEDSGDGTTSAEETTTSPDDSSSEDSDSGDPDDGVDPDSDPGWDNFVDEVGEQFPNIIATDTEGKEIDLYQWAAKKNTLVTFSAWWCGPCRNFASFYSRTGDGGSFSHLTVLRDKIDSGDIKLIELICVDENGQPGDAARWAEDYAHPKVPVIQNPAAIEAKIKLNRPSFYLMDHDMIMVRNAAQGDILETAETLP